MIGSLKLTLLAGAAAVALGALWWFDTGRLAAEHDTALAGLQTALDAAAANEAALDQAIADRTKAALEQTRRLAEAEARLSAVNKTKQEIVDVGTKDHVGPGVAAALDGLRRLARGDEGPAGGSEAGPSGADLPGAP